ncbi:MAG: putative toxin-antitoxin system toxin component, PIN family [Patescibacteria group bacterium]|jgi:hypothetical protein
MLKVVLDTNIIVSAMHRNEGSPALIVSSVLNGKLKLCLSDEIFSEYAGVLNRPRFRYLDRPAVKKVLAQLNKKSLRVCPKETIDIIKDDPEDNKFLECATEARADFLITGNKKHFPFSKFGKTAVMSPGEFALVLAKLLMR